MFTLDEERDLGHYRGLLEQIYGIERVPEVLAMLAGENVFSGLVESSVALEAFGQHQNMLAAYSRLQNAKKAN